MKTSKENTMKNKLAPILFTLMLLSSALVSAAPAPWSIAINSETKECAGHWPGDEYVAYTLLPGWKSYFPGNNNTITTEYGSCEFRKRVGDPPGEEERCCKELGLTFVSKDSVKIDSVSYPYISFLILGSFVAIAFLVIAGLIIFFIIRRILKKKICSKNRRREGRFLDFCSKK